MKVEFKDNQLFGVSLYVKTSEFKKIKNNDEEMESLIDAIDAFYTWRAMGFSIKISNMISSTYKQIKKNNGVVVFTREYDKKTNECISMYIWFLMVELCKYYTKIDS